MKEGRLAIWAGAWRDTLRKILCCAGVGQRLNSESLSLKQRFVVFVYALGTRGGTICGVATRKNRNRLLVQASQQNPRSRRNLQQLNRKHNRKTGRQSKGLRADVSVNTVERRCGAAGRKFALEG